MKKACGKALSLLLAFLLTFTSVDVTAMAAADDQDLIEITLEEESNHEEVFFMEDDEADEFSEGAALKEDAPVVKAGTAISRIEWLKQLISTFDMDVEADDYADNYYTDIDSSYEFYKEAMVATEFGLVDVYPGEAFNPDSPATREFAAYTLNMCMGYIPDETSYTYSEADSVDEVYKDAIQVAVEKKWFALSGKSFLPQQEVTSAEAASIMTAVKAVLAEDSAAADGNFKYKSTVKVLPSSLEIKTQSDGSLLVKGYKSNDKAIAKGDIFGYVYQEEGSETQMPLAWKAESVTVAGDDLKIAVSNVDIDDAFDSISVGIEAEAPIEKAAAVSDTAQLYYVVGGTEENNFEDGEFFESPEELQGQTPNALVVKDNLDLTNYGQSTDLGDGAKATYSVTVTNFKYTWGANSSKAYFTTDFDVNVSASINVDFIQAANIDVPFASIPVAPGLFYDVGFRLKLDGKLAATYVEHVNAGINWSKAGGTRFTKSFKKKSFTTTAELTGSMGFYASIHADYLVMNASIYASMGMAGRLRKCTYDSGKPRECKSVEIWLYAEVGYDISIAKGTYKDRHNYVFYNDKNSPVKIGVHYEDGVQVEKCTRDSEFKSKTSKSAGYHGGSWFAPLNSQYYYNGKSSKVGEYTIFTYDTNDDGEAVITGYKGTAKNVYIPETLDGLYVVAIGAGAFANNQVVHSVSMSDRIKTIGNDAFKNCKNLSSITFSNKLNTLGIQVFNGCTSLTEVTIPKTLKSVNAWEDFSWKRSRGSFAGTGIKKVTFEDGTTSIPYRIFTGCSTLQKVVMPDSVVTIESNAFSGCSSLTDINISKNVKSIGGSAFADCTSLKSITLPETLLEIGWSGFENCSSLSNVVLPGKIERLCERAFAACTSMKEITIPKTLVHFCEHEDFTFRWSFGCFSESGLEKVIFEDGTTEIPKRALLNCASLKEIVMPESVTSTGYQSFAGCTSLEEVTFPSKFVTIGSQSFRECTGLKSVVLNESIEEIGNSAFEKCTSLETVEFPKGIKRIGDYAFTECKKIKEVKLEAPEELCRYAFNACSGLTTVEIKSFKNDKDWQYRTGVFCGCKYLTKVTLPENEEYAIPYKMFYSCENLKTIKLNSGVNSIGESAFANCTSLVSIDVPDSVSSIGNEAFYNCSDLEDVTLGTGLEEINESLFAKCSSLQSINIPGKVHTIHARAFIECPMLTEAYIGKNVKSIEDNSFSYYTQLIVYGIKNSYAQNWAEKNGATFVEKEIPVTSLSFNETTIKLPDTKTDKQLSVSVLPKNFNTELTFSSSDEEVVKVDSTGILTPGTKIGTATITVRSGKVSATCKVETFVAVRSFYINYDNGYRRDGTNYTKFKVNVLNVYPENALDKTGTLSIEDYDGKQSGFIDQDGFVCITDADRFNVYYTANDGGGARTYLDVDAFYKTCNCSDDISLFQSPHYKNFDSTNDYRYWIYYAPGASSITLTFSEATDVEQTIYSYNNDSLYLYDKRDSYNDPAGYVQKVNFRVEDGKTSVTLKGNYIRIDYYALYDGAYGFKVDKVEANGGAATYSLTFDNNGHGVTPAKLTNLTAIPSELPVLSEEGYTFGGWYYSKDCKAGDNAVAGTPLTKDTTLYAKWTAKVSDTLSAPYATDSDGNALASGAELSKGTLIYLTSDNHGAAIYYTTDSSQATDIPEDDAHLYKSAITFEDDVTIFAKAVKSGFKSSTVAQLSFRLKDTGTDWGDITEKDRSSFANADEVPEGLWVAGVEDTDYTGEAIVFDDLHVYHHKTLLKEVDDYTVKYSGNVNASTDSSKAAITITGKGNYAGTRKETFVIKALSLGDGETNSNNLQVADVSAEYTGSVIKLTTAATYDVNGTTVTLKSGTDFDYDYSLVKAEPGTYTVKLVGKGNFTGTAVFTETIYDKAARTDISKLTFGKIPAQTADGTAKEPALTITDKANGKTLLKDTDYTAVYMNNIAAGTATVVVTGIGNYAGTKALTFKMTGTALKKASFTIGNAVYSGEKTSPAFVVTYQGRTLTEGTDYRIALSNNVKKGTGKITFTGMGSFTGSVKKTFKIAPLSFAGGEVTLTAAGNTSADTNAELGTLTYTKGGVKPAVTLTYKGKELVEGKDYKVKYANNNAVGGTKTPTLTVKGAGNFTGTFVRTFAIKASSLSNVTVSAADIVATTKAGTCKPKVTVSDSNGAILAAGKDYEKKFSVTYASTANIKRKGSTITVNDGDDVDVKNDIIPAGTDIRVVVTGKGLYQGSTKEAIFTYVNTVLTKAKVKLPKAPYTYTGEKIVISEKDMIVTVGGNILPVGAYRVTSYSQNIKKGTASVTITGAGNYNGIYYGGSKTVTFKINAMKLQ